MKKSEKSKEKTASKEKQEHKPNAGEEKREHKQSSTHFSNPAAEIFKAFAANMKNPTIDREAVINNHRKNLDVINDANKMAVEVVKIIAQLQSQYMNQTFEDMNNMMREMSAVQPSSSDRWESQAGKIKSAVTKAIDHSANIANIMFKSNHELYERMQDRFNDHLDEMKRKTAKYKN